MRALAVDQLRPGYALAVSLVDEKGSVLLQRGVQLTEPYIRALKEKGFTRLYIKDDTGVDIEPDENLSPAVRWRATRALEETFSQIAGEIGLLRGRTAEEMREAITSDRIKALVGPGSALAKLGAMVDGLLEDILSQTTLAGLTSLKNAESGHIEHAIDVCVISVMLGSTIGLDNRQLRQLATGALLHDIGMLFVAEDATPRARIIQHTQLGFELLKQAEDADILAPYVAYEHHEHQDGSGLPRGLTGSNTISRVRGTGKPVPTLIGEVAAIANAYENLVSGVRGVVPITPEDALQRLQELAGSQYNTELVRAFRRIVQIYPRGTQVRLSGKPYDNFTAVVSETSQTQPGRPKVILVLDAKRNRVAAEEVDTAEHPELVLRSVGL